MKASCYSSTDSATPHQSLPSIELEEKYSLSQIKTAFALKKAKRLSIRKANWSKDQWEEFYTELEKSEFQCQAIEFLSVINPIQALQELNVLLSRYTMNELCSIQIRKVDQEGEISKLKNGEEREAVIQLFDNKNLKQLNLLGILLDAKTLVKIAQKISKNESLVALFLRIEFYEQFFDKLNQFAEGVTNNLYLQRVTVFYEYEKEKFLMNSGFSLELKAELIRLRIEISVQVNNYLRNNNFFYHRYSGGLLNLSNCKIHQQLNRKFPILLKKLAILFPNTKRIMLDNNRIPALFYSDYTQFSQLYRIDCMDARVKMIVSPKIIKLPKLKRLTIDYRPVAVDIPREYLKNHMEGIKKFNVNLNSDKIKISRMKVMVTGRTASGKDLLAKNYTTFFMRKENTSSRRVVRNGIVCTHAPSWNLQDFNFPTVKMVSLLDFESTPIFNASSHVRLSSFLLFLSIFSLPFSLLFGGSDPGAFLIHLLGIPTLISRPPPCGKEITYFAFEYILPRTDSIYQIPGRRSFPRISR